MNRVVYPNAKLNIGLKVLCKREDGFHNIETLFLPVPTLTDILEISDNCHLEGEQGKDIIRCGKVLFRQTGIEAGNPADNLCIKAYNIIDEATEGKLPPVYIHLHKQIPVGAGLGGGSADASFTLKTINSIYECGLSNNHLKELSLQLGSDCPFFIENTPMLGEGRGELLTPIEFSLPKGYRFEFLFPPLFVSTADAYRGIVPRNCWQEQPVDNSPLTELVQAPIEEWKNLIFNDFEHTVFAKYPVLAEYKQSLYNRGAVYASMSGSGSSMFGIFK